MIAGQSAASRAAAAGIERLGGELGEAGRAEIGAEVAQDGGLVDPRRMQRRRLRCGQEPLLQAADRERRDAHLLAVQAGGGS